jgi:malic enzyme
MEQQARRAYGNIARKSDALERFIGLAALQDRNEHLFYRVLADHIEEFLPIVYTPTVGLACQQYSRIFRRARGLWITPEQKGHMAEVLTHTPYEDVRLIVVTDNERILGLGDQGAGGMGIPVGKVALYVAAAGIHPAQTLPISLDVGTDNEELLQDDLYIGWRHPRLRGDAYDAVVDELVRAVKLRFPKALLQWEDFKQWNAVRLLERYRHELPSFNDDIQGTAAVAVAGVTTAARAARRPLRDERVVIVGAGAAGVGIARLLRTTLAREGLAGEALRAAIALVDAKGLIAGDDDENRRDLAWTAELAAARGVRAGSPLLEAVRALRPTVLVGVTGVAGLFGEEVVRAMAEGVERPAIFPLSNPTSSSEARPIDLMAWTSGRALVATGSPFDPVAVGDRHVRIGQSNNAFIFPGVGLGALVSEAREVTDSMFGAAADALAEQVSAEDLAAGSLFPRVSEIRRITARVAEAVVRQASADGVARNRAEDPAEAVAAAMWDPVYPAIDVL